MNFCQNQKESNTTSWCILDQLSTYSFASRFQSSTNHVLSFSNVYICKENTAAIQKIFTYYNYSSACVNSVELGTFAATKASLFVVRKFFNMNSMHGTHTFCLQMSGLSVFFRKPLNHFLRNATHSPNTPHGLQHTYLPSLVCKKHPVPLMSKSWQQILVF